MKEDEVGPAPDIRGILNRHSTADRKARAVSDVEALVKSGTKVRAAVEEVAFRSGLGERTLYTCLQKTRGVPHGEREAALAPKRTAPRRRVNCHPDALKRFIDLCRQGHWVTECYRKMKAEAEAKGWTPIPSERTLRRELDRQVSWTERFVARRATK